MHRLQEFVERDTAILKDRADLDRELLLAVAAAIEAVADALFGLRLDLGDPVHSAAVRANWTVRPQNGLKMLEGGFLIVEIRLGKNRYGSTP